MPVVGWKGAHPAPGSPRTGAWVRMELSALPPCHPQHGDFYNTTFAGGLMRIFSLFCVINVGSKS